MTKTDRLNGGAVPRYLSILVAAVLALTLMPGAAFAQTAADGDACPAEGQEDAFPDDDGNIHEDNINCAAAYDITQGFPDGTYKPGRSITRAQMATFIVNFLTVAGANLPEGSDDAFTDDDNSVHEGNINILADADIVQGFGGGLYRPENPVSREQMATYIAGAIEFDMQDEMDAGDDAFTDDETSVHESNINKLAEAEVVQGTGGTNYSPRENVSRAQMATFIMQAADFLDAIGEWLPTAGASLALAADEAQAGGTLTGVVSGDVTDVDVSGCGLTNQDLNDNNATADGFQFEITIPNSQTAGECELTFTITQEDGGTFEVTRTITVTPRGTGGTGVTTDPELVSAQIVGTVTTAQQTPTNPAGTTVRYCFDEDVSGGARNEADFFVYTFNNTRIPATAEAGGAPDNARVDTDPKCVLVRFTGTALDTQAEADNLTLATVDEGAVVDGAGNTNPEGDAAIGSGRTDRAGTAGVTDAPDLTTVSNFRDAADTGEVVVDFTFDETAFVVTPGGYHLVLTDGTEVNCLGPGVGTTNAGGGTSVGGNGTATHTVECTNPTTGDFANIDITQANTARGYVDTGTVRDGTSAVAGTDNLNVLQAADVSNSGNSAEPDLVSATFRPGAGSNDTDQVLFVFDEAVNAAATGANFFVYDPDSNEVAGSNPQRNPGNNREVLVDFPSTALDDAVGASVEDAAVTAADNNAANEEDEVGVTNNNTTQVQPGQTTGPNLTGVAIADSTTAFGKQVTYTFDEDVDLVAANRLWLYQSDGLALQCSNASNPTGEDADNTVICTAYGGATAAMVENAVLGTADFNAVVGEGAADSNPEHADVASGSAGTPRQ